MAKCFIKKFVIGFSLTRPRSDFPSWSCSSTGKLACHWPGPYSNKNRRENIGLKWGRWGSKMELLHYLVACALQLSAVLRPAPATCSSSHWRRQHQVWAWRVQESRFPQDQSKRPGTVCFKAAINNKDIRTLQGVITLWDSLPQGGTDRGGLAGYIFTHNKNIICRKKPNQTQTNNYFCLCFTT